MIRIILLFLLTLTLSSVNARPEPKDEPAAKQAPKTHTMAPEAARNFEVPAMKPADAADKQKTAVKSTKPAKSASTTRREAKTAQQAKQTAPVAVPAESLAEQTPVAPASTTAAEVEPAPENAARATKSVFGANSGRTLSAMPAVTELPVVTNISGKKQREQRFLPTRKRMDREINKIKFAYKGEVITGLTASYGTLSSDDTDFLLILDNIDAKGTIASVKPFVGYFYRNNNCIGVRFGYSHVGGTINNTLFDLGESNDVSLDIPYLDLQSNNYSFGIFHRSYAGLDPKGRFGLFAEFELAVSTGSSEFAYESGDVIRRTFSDNTQVKLSFNPGAAVYIFPNVCATLSFGLGGIQYTHVTQKDAEGNKIGSRKSSNMKFKLNIMAINIGMTIHLWNKKKD